MVRTPTQLVAEHLSGDPALLRDARQRLTLADHPVGFHERIAHVVQRPAPQGYAVRHNERIIRTHGHLGALRRALVQWATQYAPRGIGSYHGLLMWALAQVDWPTVIQCISLSPQRSVGREIERRERRAHRERRGRFLLISSPRALRSLRPLR